MTPKLTAPGLLTRADSAMYEAKAGGGLGCVADEFGGTYEAMLARAAWHEWAHALAVVRDTR